MRKLAVVAVVLLLSGFAFAQAGGTGLGVIVGEPTGISMKFWTGGNTAFDAAAAWSVYRYTAFHFHADLLFHNLNLIDVSPGLLPAYVGVGGRLKLAGEPNEYKDMRLGVRVPFGLEYLFEPIPVGLFVEVAPILDILPGTGFSINGAAGARWYFR
jgi:hypothetical protein